MNSARWLDEAWLGRSPRLWLTALFVLVLGWLLGRLARLLLTRVVPRWTARTATTLDDRLVERLAVPTSVLVWLASARLACVFLELSAGTQAFVSGSLGVAVVVVLASMALRTIDVVHEELVLPWAGRQEPPPSAQALHFARGAIKVLAVVLLLLVALQRAGVDVLSLIAGLGIGGLAVALAAQETLGNLLGSLQLMTDRPFSVGDWIVLDGKLARVGAINLRSTRLRLANGVQIVMPNKKLAEALVENHSVPGLGLVRDHGLVIDGTTPVALLEAAMAALTAELATVSGVRSPVSVQLGKVELAQVELRMSYVADPEQCAAVVHAVQLQALRVLEREGCRPLRKPAPPTTA